MSDKSHMRSSRDGRGTRMREGKKKRKQERRQERTIESRQRKMAEQKATQQKRLTPGPCGSGFACSHLAVCVFFPNASLLLGFSVKLLTEVGNEVFGRTERSLTLGAGGGGGWTDGAAGQNRAERCRGDAAAGGSRGRAMLGNAEAGRYRGGATLRGDSGWT